MEQVTSNFELNVRAFKESLKFNIPASHNLTEHLHAVMRWLCRAHDMTTDDGVSQTYLVRYKKWANSYPETTGYIIPTMYRYWAISGLDEFRERARKMTDWECDIQLPNGGVLAGAIGDSDKPTVFNTGQVLFGWTRAFEIENIEKYRESAVKAAHWLCNIMDDDGCWRAYGSPMTLSTGPNLYNTRSAWGLTRTHQISGEKRFLDCAIKNLEWAQSKSHVNGWLEENCLQDNSQPFLHTIAYAMRGFLEVGIYAQRQDFVDLSIKIGDALLHQLPATGYMPGRFNKDWEPTVKWCCLTGNAQIAINWGRLYQLTGDTKYKEAVIRINKFTRSTQKLKGNPDELGGIKGSHPINGGYHPWQYPNWAAKFFADALCMEGYLTNLIECPEEMDNVTT
ncbi:hypothetical protein [Sedimenticola hydrogenitrophicus]|uniref:hypothetical protein n=1 Tax=Sedimenticola hydrogenitrophicus TaxID=2967975 RepID=UPI0023AF3E8D|nr:hypothetical protein [Sedimenticola hydrogenitrophicus]